jgi:hypothetical protein
MCFAVMTAAEGHRQGTVVSPPYYLVNRPSSNVAISSRSLAAAS